MLSSHQPKVMHTPNSPFKTRPLRFLLLGLLTAWLGLSAVMPLQAATILFVHAPSGGVPSATDQALINELSLGLGHKVNLRPVSSAAEKPAGSEADTVDLVIVSESVGSGNVADAFKEVTKPVLLLEAFIADDMQVATPGTLATQSQVDIVNPDHPLAAGLSGTVDIYKSAKTLSTFTSASTDAIKVASGVGQPDVGAMLAFLPGAKMESDFVAPGRRVCLGLHSAVPEEFTSQAKALFRAAVTWSMGLPVPSVGAQTKPVIARQPADIQVFVEQQAELGVEARGTEPLSYQWKRADKDIDGATSNICRFRVVAADDGAVFTVAVKNALGNVTSQPAKLTVLPENGKKVVLLFSEGKGTTTTNLGNLSGSAKFALANNYPQFSTKVPAGPFAPSNNSGSVDFGAIDEGQGGRAIDFTNPYAGGIGSYPSITICGWLNSRDLRAGSGGNRIAFAAVGVGGPGFDLSQNLDGTLKLGVNQAPDAAPQSSALITEDPNTGSANWVFFAVTYDSALPSGNVSFYFGRGDAAATLDSTLDYAQGPIDRTGELSLGNFAAVDLNRNVQGPDQSRVFRGLMDEIRIFRSALTLAEIQSQQKATAQPPTVPVPLTASLTTGGVLISWPVGGTFQLESRPLVNSGTWSSV